MTSRLGKLVLLLAAVACLVAAAGSKLTPLFGPWKRISSQPILRPQGNGFESAGVFNPAVVRDGDRFVMLYRAQDKNGTSRLGYATSSDGVRFIPRPQPVFVPETDYEKDG